ncbi:hypothetical protein J6906_000777 [Campylobacter coli]|nr:hypothetical protein [Campylobacter coli]EHH0181161.1 hypothetical protein [Campylobacter coli]
MVKFKLSVDLVNNRFSPFLNFFMVKLWQFLKELGACFSPFLNFFMVKSRV